MDRLMLEGVIKTFQIGGETFVRIKNVENSDPPLRYGDVTEYIKGLNIKNVDFNAVKQAYKNCRGQSVCIGGSSEERAHLEQSEHVIEVSGDAMICTLTLSPPEGRSLPEVSDIIEAMKIKNIVFGLEKDNVKEALEKGIFGKKIIAARGVYPEAGKDAGIKLLPGLFGGIRDFRSEYGTVEQFKKSTFICALKESDPVALKMKETSGREGRTIFGDEIETLPGVPLESSDANIFMSDEQVFANVDGHVVSAGAGVRVEPLLILKSITNRKIGHEGSVKILGDVESCPLIEASGDIEIHGTVNNTSIHAGRNIIIHGNLFTKQDKGIVAGNNFLGQNVSNAVITAENITITSTCFNSILTAYRTIQNTGSEGKIVGGRTLAGLAFFAAALGSSTNIPTEISVATPDIFNEHKAGILGYYTKKIRELNDHLVMLEKKSESIDDLKNKLARDRRAVYNGLTRELKAWMDQDEFKINRLQDKIASMKSQGADAIQGEVLANKIFPNTSLSLGPKKTVVNETLSNVRMQIKEGEIATNTFHRTSMKW